jgi:AraC-like DNA-binding protein
MKVSRIEFGPQSPGLERMKAFFRGHSFAPHRHDTYAVGFTTAGVQAFDYRGSSRYSLPGQVFVLHPDERHDGRSGDERGFGYKIAYIDPALIRDAAGSGPLPFLKDPVCRDRRLRDAVAIITRRTEPQSDLATTCDLAELAEALVCAAQGFPIPTGTLDIRAVRLAREILLAKLDTKVALSELESVTGLSRWDLARQFRKAYGINPYRFHLLRRLDRARELLRQGSDLVDVAQALGFADQAHLSRHFRQAYGLPPGQWRGLVA